VGNLCIGQYSKGQVSMDQYISRSLVHTECIAVYIVLFPSGLIQLLIL